MKLTMLHDGSLKPRASKLSKDISQKPSRLQPKDAVPELDVVDKHYARTSGLAYDMANSLSQSPRRPMETNLELGTGK